MLTQLVVCVVSCIVLFSWAAALWYRDRISGGRFIYQIPAILFSLVSGVLLFYILVLFGVKDAMHIMEWIVFALFGCVLSLCLEIVVSAIHDAASKLLHHHAS